MKINGFLLADKSQSAPIPIPGEEVTTGISWSIGNVKTYYRMDDNRGSIDTGSPTYGYSNVDWYSREDQGYLPLRSVWEHDFHASETHTSCYWWLIGCEGSITLNIQNLTAGKYVIVVDYYIGTRDIYCYDDNPQRPRAITDIQNPKATKTVKQGANGVVYGEINPSMVIFDTNAGYAIGEGRVFKITQKCSIEVEEGDTSKIITYGDSSFSFLDFYDSVKFYTVDQYGNVQSWWSQYSTAINNPVLRFGLRPRLYTAA